MLSFIIVITLLLAVAALCFRAERRRDHRSQPPDRLDSMIDVVRDDGPGHQNHAWPPGTTAPPVPAPRAPGDTEFDAWADEWERRFAE